MLDRKHEQLGYEIDTARGDDVASIEASLDDDVGDDLLRLIFTACHPVLSTEAQVALTLRLLCGLTTEEIARAFLLPEPTIAQRIVRAKKALAKAKVPFEVPRGPDREARLASVLAVIYLVFNEGYSATAGDDWIRPSLCEEALRLVRVLAALAPDDAEVHGLAALLELQASRLKARVDAAGRPVRLNEQDRSRWDRILIARGLEALRRARGLRGGPGPYTIQAGIAACHATSFTPVDTDWRAIVALYDQLLAVQPSPIVALNRAVAVSMAVGPQAGLDLVEELRSIPALAEYHLLPAVRGDFLERLGRIDEARGSFARAAELAQNGAERELLRERIRGLAR
jgi:predicted RNA polymerase sigma factor